MTAVSTLLVSLVFTAGAPRNVLLDFSATWCGPCRQMKPVVAELERQGLPVVQVDIDQHPDLARKFGVQSVPTFLLLINGRVVDRVVGVTSSSRLRQMALRAQQARMREHARLASTADTSVVRANNERLSEGRSRSSLVEPDLSCCVRIRVRDEGGISFGSGTIIASQPGRSVILTCGHIFRDLDTGSQIKVDVFHGDEVETFDGRVVCYDLEADVGLMTIDSLLQLPSAPVAPEGYQLRVGEPVVSFGCSGGEAPTRQSLQVTALNRYLGPDNVECTGVPVQGRSGGGLFNRRGEVVGVCIAADPQDRRGLYAGPKAVHAVLRRAGLDYLLRRSAEPPATPQLARSDSTASGGRPSLASSAAAATVSPSEPFARPRSVSPARAAVARTRAAEASGRLNVSPAGVPPVDAAATAHVAESDGRTTDWPDRSPDDVFLPPQLARGGSADVQRGLTATAGPSRSSAGQRSVRLAQPTADGVPVEVLEDAEAVRRAFGELGEAEVVCIIRPLRNPTAVSRVVIIRRASPKFVADLVGEMQQGGRRGPTASTASSSAGELFRPAPPVRPAAYTVNEVRPTQLQFQQLRVRRFERAPVH